MKTYNIHILTFILLAFISISAFGQKKITLLHTSDTHSRIEPIKEDSGDKFAGMGGFARRVAAIKELRKEDPNILLFDCGDFSQGTPYYNLFKGELEVKMMNLMGYNAVLIGNHEFDFGLDNLAALCKLATFPIVCSNYDVEQTVLKGMVKPYITFVKDGIKIGVIGVSPKLEGLVEANKYGGVVYSDPVDIANTLALFLKTEEKCDAVVCLSHLGVKEDKKFIANTSHIDVVLGGHSHTWMEKPAYYINAVDEKVPLLHTGKNGIFVGEIELTFGK